MNKTAVLMAAVGSLFALRPPVLAAAANPATERCYAVAKAGKNDCAGPGHVCAGLAKTDANPDEWLAVPKGTCERIVGGCLQPAHPDV